MAGPSAAPLFVTRNSPAMRNDDNDRERGVTFIGPRAFVLGFAAFCAGFVGLVYAAERVSDSIETLPPAAGLIGTMPEAGPTTPPAGRAATSGLTPFRIPAAPVRRAALPAHACLAGAEACAVHTAHPVVAAPAAVASRAPFRPTAPHRVAAAPPRTPDPAIPPARNGTAPVRSAVQTPSPATAAAPHRPAALTAHPSRVAPAASPPALSSAKPAPAAPLLLPLRSAGIAGGGALAPRDDAHGSLMVAPANAAPPAGALSPQHR